MSIDFMLGGVKLYQRYAKLRDEKGVTDYEVSKNTGISTSTLTNWKYGRYTPKLEKIKLIADYFNVSIEYFIGNGEV